MRHSTLLAPGARFPRISGFLLLLPGLLLLSAPGAWAQVEVRSDETLASHRPEAWAMKYMAASTLMTSFGETSAPAPWRWRAALEAGHIPKLSVAQQRVGFNGTKQEDLNKSPVFGRFHDTHVRRSVG